MIRSTAIRIVLGAGLVAVLAQASPADLAAQASKGVHVCLGVDNVLRFTSSERCPQGQRMFRLAEVEDEVGVTKDRDDPPNAVVADLKSKVDFLTRRVSNLEDELRKRDADPSPLSRVTAPFEVVDKSGNAIFVVTDADYPSAKRRGRIHIGRATGGANYSLLAHNGSGAVVAGIGEGKETGTGSLLIADNAGKLRVRLSANDGVTVYNASSGPVGEIKAGSQGAGQFWLYDASGTPMVKAGTTAPGIGLIQAGPGNKCVPSAGLRVPDCILGRQMQ
jgi:hypothetical protein